MTLRLAAALVCTALATAAFGQTSVETSPVQDPLAEYERTLREGSFHTAGTLSVVDVAYAFEKYLAGRDASETARIAAWRGVHQDRGVATVLYAVAAADAVFGHELVVEDEAVCRHLVDGRWRCRVDIPRLGLAAGFYVETPPAAEELAAAEGAVAPAALPLRPSRP